MVRITPEFIAQCKTVAGGITQVTRIALGVSDQESKVKGWTYRLLGKLITKEQAQAAIEGNEKSVRQMKQRAQLSLL